MAAHPTAVLYTFEGSVWASVPTLLLSEKKLGPEHCQVRSVDLFKGENFAPSYLKISPKGTVPALVVPYESSAGSSSLFKSLTTTKEICTFLDDSTLASSLNSPSFSPATIAGAEGQQTIIDFLHSNENDPNFMFMSFRTEDERKKKNAGPQGAFVRGRQEALLRFAQAAGDEDARLAVFYENKIKENGGLLQLYEGKADLTSFFKMSSTAYDNLPKALAFLENHLKSGSSYLVGDQLALADLHAGAWLMRILAVAGGKTLAEAAATLATLGQYPKLHGWLDLICARDSFKLIYGEGLH